MSEEDIASHPQPCAGDQLQTMFVHWRGSPLWRAMLPPPSFTPRTASMPRSSFRTARLSRQLRRAALDVEAVVSRSLGDVALEAAMAVLLSDQEPVLAAVPDQVSAD